MICETCKHQPKRCSHAVDYGEMIGCSFYTPRIATKADEIRNMTDEELAKFLQEPFCDKRTHDECTISYCRVCDQCVLDWLQQPAEVDE